MSMSIFQNPEKFEIQNTLDKGYSPCFVIIMNYVDDNRFRISVNSGAGAAVPSLRFQRSFPSETFLMLKDTYAVCFLMI